MSFPKHEWYRRITCDENEDLTPWIRLLGVNLSTSASAEDGAFTVHRKTVADRMGKSLRFVHGGYVLLEKFGYIESVSTGRTGRPANDAGKRQAAATWRLSFPELVNSGSPVSTETGERPRPKQVNGHAETGERPRPKQVNGHAADSPSTSENADTVGLIGGLKEGLEGGDARGATDEPLNAEVVLDHGDDPHPPQHFSEARQQPADVGAADLAGPELLTQQVEGIDDGTALDGETDSDPRPEPKCKRHPDGDVGEPCRACRRDNDEIEAWQQRQKEAALLRILSSVAESPRTERPAPEPKPPPSWIHGTYGPRCPRHGHLKVPPSDCNRCDDAAIAARESA
ncbi:hypothetical protein [Mycobacteroides abscessus]|uniref:hypothetical protein n=1 Tax=Mycobacteroides abscessus TaxID=36809 RepID=UPI0009283FC3|nr:hypothetical protein [Mycobacteroides abscessus]SIK28948.1 Uncharacterised protein [Mycobacteroides abscessus subsp. abscessus]